jgi:hypothetical protein
MEKTRSRKGQPGSIPSEPVYEIVYFRAQKGDLAGGEELKATRLSHRWAGWGWAVARALGGSEGVRKRHDRANCDQSLQVKLLRIFEAKALVGGGPSESWLLAQPAGTGSATHAQIHTASF